MLKGPELARLKRELNDLQGLSYDQIAAVLTEKFGRKISRSTVRYYLEAMPSHESKTKGRPPGSTRERDVRDQLLPELLLLTGLSASHLYRVLRHLLGPAQLTLGKSAFHKRLEGRLTTEEPVKKKSLTLLERCNLRIKIVTVSQPETEGKRFYLFGYEEFTGYTAFDVISPAPPNVGRISSFIRTVEEHLGLPVRRICLIGKEFAEFKKPSSFKQVAVLTSSENTTSQLFSPYARRAEIDLLQRIAKKQNDEVARTTAAVAKEAISHFIQLARLRNGVWESPAQRGVTQQLQAEAADLEPFIKMRFKLYVPRRRPT